MVRNEIDSCAELLRPHLNLDLRQILFPSKGREEEAQNQLTQTAITQPALFVIEHAIARLLEDWGVVPVGMIGHSLGDYVAACLAGVFSRDDALVLLAKRARLMQDLPAGSMLAVRARADKLQELLSSQVAIAGLNAETMTVLSGDTDAIRSVEETSRLAGSRPNTWRPRTRFIPRTWTLSSSGLPRSWRPYLAIRPKSHLFRA